MEAEKKEEKGSSTSSSPSHEFSFTISLDSSSTGTTEATTPEKTRHRNQAAIDLTPADEIFFHGHLLPLHFLSHLHAASVSSPRHSTNSMDSFTLPIRDMLGEPAEDHKQTTIHDNRRNEGSFEAKGRKPFSLFGLSKWRKAGSGSGSGSDSESKQQQEQQERRKLRFDLSQFVKRYMKMVKPLLTSKGSGAERGRNRESLRFRRQTYSFSGAVSPRERRDIRGRNGEYSAPASMRASPTNSGLLLATAGVPSPSTDSTMEELHAAIQAAIAHCKNSIAAADNNSPQLSVPVT